MVTNDDEEFGVVAMIARAVAVALASLTKILGFMFVVAVAEGILVI